MGYFDYKSSKAFINSLKATSSMYKAGDQFDQQGSFVSTRFRNDDTNFVIGTFQPDNITLEPIVCKGTVYNYMEGVPYRVKGKVVDDRTYGIQVSVSNVQAVKPSNKAQIIAFLSSGLFSGIGPATAARIYDAFGDDTMSVLENDPDKLATVKGLSKKKVDAYKEVIPRVLRFQEIVGELGALGLTMTTIKHIIDKYGDNALGIIKNNPYVLTKIRGFGFTRADQIARKFGIGIGDPRRIMYGTYYTLDWACKNYGHTLMPEEELRSLVYEKLSMQDVPDGDGKISKAIEELISKKEFVRDDLGLHTAPLFFREEKIKKNIRRSTKKTSLAPDGNIERAIDTVSTDLGMQMTDEQIQAVYNVFGYGMSAITGSAGCGKTAVCRLVVRAVKELGFPICLMSPTGRAAKHLSDVCDGTPAYTMHRALALNVKKGDDADAFSDDEVGHSDIVNDATRDFKRAKVVLIDEASMLDTDMVAELLDQANGRKHIVFVGDYQQLPPVGCGQPFFDFIDGGVVKTTRLTKIFRQAEGSPVIVAANKVLQGESPCYVKGVHFVECQNGDVQAALAEQVLPRIRREIRDRDVMFLSPMKKTPVSGVNALNDFLRPIMNSKYKAPKQPPQHLVLQVGDIVLQTRNNYDDDVFNGDIGVVDEITDDKLFRIRFDGHLSDVEYNQGEVFENLQLAYSMTVHKAQGSQAKVVVGIMTDSFYVMASPNILYTMITRAEEELYLVGSPKMFSMAAKNKKVSKRYTGLKHLMH